MCWVKNINFHNVACSVVCVCVFVCVCVRVRERQRRKERERERERYVYLDDRQAAEEGDEGDAAQHHDIEGGAVQVQLDADRDPYTNQSTNNNKKKNLCFPQKNK